MNRIEIGNFIAKCRKDKGITQEQLVIMLNITNKSVSKWETGTCLPDSTLYEPLCKILDVTLDELFLVKEKDIKQKAKDNLLYTIKHKLYEMSDKSLSFEEFDNALTRISEITTILKEFSSKEEAVQFLMKETNTTHEECSKAYDFYTKMFQFSK